MRQRAQDRRSVATCGCSRHCARTSTRGARRERSEGRSAGVSGPRRRAVGSGRVQDLGEQAARGAASRRDSSGRRARDRSPVRRSAAGVPEATPYTLRHSFCSLLLHEGRSVIYVARQLGHDAKLTLEHVRARDRRARGCAPRVGARRRSGPPARPVCHWCVTGGGAMMLTRHAREPRNPRMCGGSGGKPSAGLEPATPSLPWKCSTN